MTERRRKKGLGCGKFFITLLVLTLVAVILIGSGLVSKLRTKIEMLIYPLSYEEEIVMAAQEYDFEPQFLCAVIHTESKFDIRAESHAGAKGLMQIMPDTFEWLCEKRGEDHSPEDMLNPHLSIDYGTYYLRYLTDIYQDRYTACAAYNAGNTAVNEWLQDPAYSSDGVTLHTIPYEETSEYVQRIRDAEQMYQKLYFSE